VEDVGELLERIGRQMRRMERRSHHAADRWERRFNWPFRDQFGFWSDDEDEDRTVDAEGDEVVERELTFGEEPELKLTASVMNVKIMQAAPGEKTRLVLKGRDLDAVEIETGTWNGATAVELRLARGLRGLSFFGGFGHRTAYVYVPAGTRVRGRADAASLSAEGLQNGELDLRTDAGKLSAEHCSGRMRLRSNAGKLAVRACSGDLDARADAGKLQVEGFAGRIEVHAQAGSISISGLRLEPGESTVRTNMGSIDIALLPDVPVRIDARASMGSVRNRIGEGQRDALASLNVRTEMGSIRIRYDEEPPTPLRSVPVSDEREETRRESAGNGAAQAIPLDREEEPAQAAPQPATPPAGGGEENETLRILGMLERHEITAAEASALLAALRRTA